MCGEVRGRKYGIARNLLLLPIILLLGGLLSRLERLAIPAAELIDPIWAEHDESSELTVDHRAWDRFLKEYIESDAAGVNRVAYARISPADRAMLDAYLRRLARVPVPKLARQEQLAFWINLYNAETVALVLDHYPVSSIREIRFKPFALGPWSEPLLETAGRKLSLNDIEDGIIRPIWRDPRTHYVLNCAALGCPDLGKTAYTAAHLEASMEQAARDYVNAPRGVRFDGHGRLIISKIYLWYEEDFGGSTEAVLRHLQRYANPALAARLQTRARIDDYAYDWSLNDVAPAPSRQDTGRN
jgi:hypothetical protein